ncbi:MAG: hypothetical protein QOK47_1032, partial [Actinomycetota bacterium]|nr:hypothetical protein [Actinomycetota bacterium]
TGDWRTRPSPYCMSCSFHSVCPAWTEVAEASGAGEAGAEAGP